MKRLLWLLFPALALVLTTGVARADDPRSAAEDCNGSGLTLPRQAPSCGAVKVSGIKVGAAARQWWKRGQELLHAERFAEALEAFKSAYDQSKHPALLFNEALAYAGLCRSDDAAAALESFRSEAADHFDEACADWLNQALTTLRPPPPPEPPPSAPPDPPPAPVPPAPATGSLFLLCPVPGAVGNVDGIPRPIDGNLIELPAGTHSLRFDAHGHKTEASAVLIEVGQSTARTCHLAALPVKSAAGLRAVGYAAGAAGFLGVGVGLAAAWLGSEAQRDAAKQRARANADFERFGASPVDKALAHQASVNAGSDYDGANRTRTAGLVVAWIGVGALAGGTVIVLATASRGTTEEPSASVSWAPWLAAGSGGVTLDGRF